MGETLIPEDEIRILSFFFFLRKKGQMKVEGYIQLYISLISILSLINFHTLGKVHRISFHSFMIYLFYSFICSLSLNVCIVFIKKIILYAPKYSVKLKAHFDFLLIFVFENNVKCNEVIFIKLVNVPLAIKLLQFL